MKINPQTMLIVGGIGAAVALFAITRKGAAQATGEALASTAVDTVVGAGTGVVLGAGDAVGIPRTNLSECERAKAEGRTWDASFACPAGSFLKYVFGG